MNITISTPSSHLAPFIDFYKHLDQSEGAEILPPLTGYPSGYTDLLISLQKGPRLYQQQQAAQSLHGAYLVGHFDQAFSTTLGQKVDVIWVRMKPHGAYALTGIPAKEFHNRSLSLDTLFLNEIRLLTEQLLHTRDHQHRIKLVETFLWNLIVHTYTPDPRLGYLLDRMLHTKGQLKLKSLCQEVSLSYRSLDRLFWKKVGQSPKRMLQNIRFHAVLESLRSSVRRDWMQVVADHGFHDQAHFIKEFQAFTNFSPQQFVQQHQEIGRNLYA